MNLTRHQLAAMRNDIAAQQGARKVSILREDALSMIREILELRDLTERIGRDLITLGRIAREADQPPRRPRHSGNPRYVE